MQQEIEQPTLENEVIHESKKLYNEKLPKHYKITIQLITQTSLDESISQGLSEEEKIQAVIQLKSIHLEWLNISKIEKLQVFTSLNILYLQHNNISKIENLECLKNLQYLALNNNLIRIVEGLKELTNLQGLNLNDNQITKVQHKELPVSLQFLSFKNNAVVLESKYKVGLITALPMLQMLDGQKITSQERLKTIGRFPHHLVDYSERMKQFRNKQKIKKQHEEAQRKKILWFGQNVNQSQVLKQIREKTRKILDESQQQFNNELKQQKDNFELQIKVSRKIRNFKKQNYENRKKRMCNIIETNEEHEEES